MVKTKHNYKSSKSVDFLIEWNTQKYYALCC